jgi:type I restriction enzyme S subunit
LISFDGVGSCNSSLTTELLKKIEIKLPSLQEQQAIATIPIRNRRQNRKNISPSTKPSEMAMALYKHWFVDFGPFQVGEFVEMLEFAF